MALLDPHSPWAQVDGAWHLRANVHDQYLDYHDILSVGNLTEIHGILVEDGVELLVRGRAADGECAIYLDLPHNGVAVELRSREYGGELRALCDARPFDLCASA